MNDGWNWEDFTEDEIKKYTILPTHPTATRWKYRETYVEFTLDLEIHVIVATYFNTYFSAQSWFKEGFLEACSALRKEIDEGYTRYER